MIAYWITKKSHVDVNSVKGKPYSEEIVKIICMHLHIMIEHGIASEQVVRHELRCDVRVILQNNTLIG